MNKRLAKIGKNATKALLAVSVCGAIYSCKDDYKLDNESPSWLGSSIYEYLEQQGNYNNFVKLIDDLNYKEVLARTGSKTLFVADDQAFSEFFQNNGWGVHSYDELSQSQKKLLLNSAMINNAYLLEMMSSKEAGSGVNDLPEKGLNLRRETASDITDSIPFLKGEDLPVNYNEEDVHYWERFREKGLYLVMDGTTPMITHFLTAQMANNEITSEDFRLITGQTRSENDAFVYGSRVVEQDITCQNGYINRLDRVLVNPQNMAEVLRTNGRTRIFSHMMDRFSLPIYDATLTQRAKDLYGEQIDSVFQKRYFATRSQGNTTLYSDAGTNPKENPTGNQVFDKNNLPLPFDPGWNTYQTDSKTSKEQDMGVIFSPSDEKMMDFFFQGGGKSLIEAYASEYLDQITPQTKDLDLVFHALDKIPRNVIRAMINNLMKESFNSSVPSKFESIKNSAQDAMFNKNDDYHRNRIDTVLLANNGIIYVMDEVTTPAEYAAVSAPAYTETDKQIFKWAIQSETLGGIPTNYSAYLLAMSSRFSFFVPSDENFWYIDPLSFYNPSRDGNLLVGRAFNYTWDTKNKAPKATAYSYKYDVTTGTGEIDLGGNSSSVSSNVMENRLKDLLETHTIIHEDRSEMTGIDETKTGMECSQHFFVSKNGCVVYAKDAEKRAIEGDPMTVGGGWQIGNGNLVQVTDFADQSEETNGYGNGFAYTLESPMQPTIESVFSALHNNPNFQKFYELCQTDAEVLQEIGITSNSEKLKYNIFENNGGLPCYDKMTGNKVSDATNVRFFNNYRYTIYVPTNEAITTAINNGLPTWQDLRDILELDIEVEERKELTKEEEDARNLKVKAMATAIVNFVKYHFQDNSVFVDEPSIAATSYETATMNSETQTYYKVTVSSAGGHTLSVRDLGGHTCNVTSDRNIVVRDYITSKAAGVDKNTLTSSSSAVLHGIDGVLNYKTYPNGRYDSDWSSESKARAYLNEYRLIK
ncbi:MAG: fasciclin domain-containing protein [Bacteroidaceae bacterium]|nr:fasciclin domain-containing protein [Bacteroidaceae bacterium]